MSLFQMRRPIVLGVVLAAGIMGGLPQKGSAQFRGDARLFMPAPPRIQALNNGALAPVFPQQANPFFSPGSNITGSPNNQFASNPFGTTISPMATSTMGFNSTSPFNVSSNNSFSVSSNGSTNFSTNGLNPFSFAGLSGGLGGGGFGSKTFGFNGGVGQ